MADVTEKDSEQTPFSEDDSAQPDLPNIQPNSMADCRSPIPPPPSKEVICTLYEQRQKCELRRLLKHTCPELKGLGNMVEEEYADILNPGAATDIAYQGEIQSRRWIFENGTANPGDSYKPAHLMEKNIQGEHTFEELLNCFEEEGSIQGTKQQTIHSETEAVPQKDGEELSQEEHFTVNVKAKRKMFEAQVIETSRENLDDVTPGRIVISEDEKGAVQKQKRDFETYQTGTIKRNSDLSIIDITDQDCSDGYLGISRAKEVFEKGFDSASSSSPNENTSTEDETVKTNVKNRAHMFESTPLDRINWQNAAESDSIDENTNISLTSLHGFNVIHSHGALLEVSEAGHVRKANYSFIQEKGPEIQYEEVVMGSMKSILLQILARVNLNPVIVFLKEDDQGNVEIKNIEIPTHQLPFTVNQDKEYRTTNMVQVIEDLLGQETCLGKGVLIQEQASRSVETLVYVLFRHDRQDGTVIDRNYKNMLRQREIKLPISRNSDSPINICSPPLCTQVDGPISIRDDENRISNVKMFESCIENGNLDCLESPSYEDVTVTARKAEKHNVIEPDNLKVIKAMLLTNPEHDGLHPQCDKHAQNELKNRKEMPAFGGYLSTLSTDGEFEKCNVESVDEPGRCLYSQDAQDKFCEKTGKNIVTLPEIVDIVEDGVLSKFQAPITSLQEATVEAKPTQQSVHGKGHNTCPVSLENQYFTEAINKDIDESSNTFEEDQQQEGREETLKGSVQAALDSLKKSSVNVTKGDFKAAMIYRNSGKSFAGQKIINREETVAQKNDNITVSSEKIKACPPSPLSGQVTVQTPHEGVETKPFQGHPANKPSACFPVIKQTHEPTFLQESKKPPGPKPAIPPKPDHLKKNPISNIMAIRSESNAGDSKNTKAESNATEKCPGLTNLKQPQGGIYLKEPQNNKATDVSNIGTATKIKPSLDYTTRSNTIGNVATEEKRDPMLEASGGSSETQASLQHFGIKIDQTVPPVKPKRIKMATDSTVVNMTLLEPNGKPINGENEEGPESKVTMRVKKGRRESEAERRQRLSVHMDEIVKGNANAAMEIFDKLRKQEELKTILSKVEEIEGEASQEGGELRKIFESVPDWVVPQKPVNPNNGVTEKEVGRSEKVRESEMLSSMQVAFGDLEKASAAIIILKEQTLSRLMEIEETIRKALYSVSTLKSDSDIAGLSGLFKESMMAGQYFPISGNIRKISIGSSKSSNTQSLNYTGVPQKSATTEPGMQKVEKSKTELSPPETKPRAGSPSSPSFISIQSTARKSRETQESPQSQTSISALTCYNVPAEKEKRQVSMLEVQTVPKAETVIGTKTIREKYEETDCFGNKFFSSTTSTVLTTQPDNKTCFRRQTVNNPATTEVVAYPRINTPSITGGQEQL